jgi:hypothetical protein
VRDVNMMLRAEGDINNMNYSQILSRRIAYGIAQNIKKARWKVEFE